MTASVSSVDVLKSTTFMLSATRRAALQSEDSAVRAQAQELGPVLRELKDLARAAAAVVRPHSPDGATIAPTTTLAQHDFQSLLAAAERDTGSARMSDAPLDRAAVALRMAGAGSSELDIARALGMSRGEVELVLRVVHKTCGDSL